MPAISMFYGIIIRMFVGKREHSPPHFHAYYQDEMITFDIRKGEVMEGSMSKRQLKLVEAWAELHKDELMADWNLAEKNESLFDIDPLK